MLEYFLIFICTVVLLSIISFNIMSYIRYKTLRKEVIQSNKNFETCNKSVCDFQSQINKIKNSLLKIEEKIDKIEKHIKD